jgi:hypothetical protein
VKKAYRKEEQATKEEDDRVLKMLTSILCVCQRKRGSDFIDEKIITRGEQTLLMKRL